MTIAPNTNLTVFNSSGMAARNMLGGVNKTERVLSIPVREVIVHARRAERNVIQTEYVWTRNDPLRNRLHETLHNLKTPG